MNSNARIAVLMALAGTLMAAPAALAATGHAAHVKTKPAVKKVQAKPAAKKIIYQCPMDPEVTSDKPGDCPKCGMHLEKKTT